MKKDIYEKLQDKFVKKNIKKEIKNCLKGDIFEGKNEKGEKEFREVVEVSTDTESGLKFVVSKTVK